MEKDDSILDFSPFTGSTASKKRPASEIASSTAAIAAKVSPTLEDDQNKKRSTTCNISKSSSSTSLFSDAVDTMTKDESQAILKKTSLPKAPKKQSQYVRFKSLMLKQAKAAKDKETQDNITSLAKEAWNMVKDKPVADVSIEDTSSDSKLDKYIRLKAQVVADEQKEASGYSTQLENFKSNYLDAAVSFLYWETQDATTSTVEHFEKEMRSIHSNVITAWNGKDVPSKFTEIYKAAQAKLDMLQKDSAVCKIVSQLRNASEDVLYEHALEHYNLQQQLVELNTLKAKAASLETEKANEEAKQMASAYSIKSDICRDLKKLMVYTCPQLKYSPKKISCRRKGVTAKMFAVAFGVEEGCKSFSFDGDEVGLKSLRYGYLSCGKVTVKLIGDAVSASTSYSL